MWRIASQPPLVISLNDLVVSRKSREDPGTQECDTNVVVGLWAKDPTLSLAAQTALEEAFNRGTLVVSAPVFAELIAAPGRAEAFVTPFLDETGVVIDWDPGETVLRGTPE
jgi:hypothetical protein